MSIMAIAATRRRFLATRSGQTVDAQAVALGLFLVAFGAVNGSSCNVIVGVLYGNIRVTTRAGVGAVN
jgi:hypothetical protein